MCTAGLLNPECFSSSHFQHHHSSRLATTTTSVAASRFQMKHPRRDNHDFDDNATRGRDIEACAHSHRQRQDESTTSANTPRASGGSSVRRSQSANAPRATKATSGLLIRNSRSHSQEPVPGRNQRIIWLSAEAASAVNTTQELPIPPPGRDRSSAPSPFTVDESELARMYDFATWNMYERIVNARRRRLSYIDSTRRVTAAASCYRQRSAGPACAGVGAQQRRASEPDASSEGCERRAAALAASARQQQLLLSKVSSGGDESTAATIDETDKSSTASSSSWSRTDSPGTVPMGLMAFPSSYERAVSSCPPPGANDDQGDEDHFIFQLDM